jgi:hypothetical protein
LELQGLIFIPTLFEEVLYLVSPFNSIFDLCSHEVALLWATAHLPFIMSFVLAAGSLSKLVIATDVRDAKIEDLTDAYSMKSDREIPVGLRWFYCVGLGISLFCMGTFPYATKPLKRFA